MTNKEIDKILESFLERFNEMCQNEKKHFLYRERTVTYENSTRIKKYQVTYKLKKENNGWTINAVSNGFWVFKKKFPLLRITKTNDQITFSGMFTSTINQFSLDKLEEKLEVYLDICKKQPENVFTKS